MKTLSYLFAIFTVLSASTGCLPKNSPKHKDAQLKTALTAQSKNLFGGGNVRAYTWFRMSSLLNDGQKYLCLYSAKTPQHEKVEGEKLNDLFLSAAQPLNRNYVRADIYFEALEKAENFHKLRNWGLAAAAAGLCSAAVLATVGVPFLGAPLASPLCAIGMSFANTYTGIQKSFDPSWGGTKAREVASEIIHKKPGDLMQVNWEVLEMLDKRALEFNKPKNPRTVTNVPCDSPSSEMLARWKAEYGITSESEGTEGQDAAPSQGESTRGPARKESGKKNVLPSFRP